MKIENIKLARALLAGLTDEGKAQFIDKKDEEIILNDKDNRSSIVRIPIQENSPVIVITSQDMDSANSQMLKFICNAGKKLDFGDPKEKKFAWEAHVTLQLTGKVLEDCYLGKAPKNFPFGPESIKAYQREYFNLLKCLTFFYHYKIRLEDYNGVNQIEYMRECIRHSIKEELNTNRIVAVLWDPQIDPYEREVPCFNWCQVRRIRGDIFRLEILYRSWDVTAVWSNLAGLIKYFVDEVIEPAGAVLGEVIITGTSTHCYRHNFDYATLVVGQENSRRLR